MKKNILCALLILLICGNAFAATELPGLTWERSMEKIYATEFNVD